MPQKKSHRVLRICMIVISAIFLIWFLLPLFTGVKPNIGMLTGAGVFLLVLFYGIFLDPVNQFLKKLWKSIPGRILEILVAVILAVIFTTAGVTLGCIIHANLKQAEPEKTLILLGCKVNGNDPSLTLLSRLNAALQYLEENPDSVCVVTGGQGDGEIVTEASVMQRWLMEHGISPSRILAEDQAEDTRENLLFSLDLLEHHPEVNPDIAIATSEFHVYRALYIARSLGITADPVSANTPWWLLPTYTVREMYGILESWILNSAALS